MKARKNIAYYEIVPKTIYEKYKHFKRGMMRLFDERMLDFAQWFIERHGTCYLNNWYLGGDHDSRGWRPADDHIVTVNCVKSFNMDSSIPRFSQRNQYVTVGRNTDTESGFTQAVIYEELSTMLKEIKPTEKINN